MTQPAIKLTHPFLLREAHTKDVEQIYELLSRFAEQEIILPRSKFEILNQLPKFSVIESDECVAGCAALEIFTQELCEVRSLAVNPVFAGQGYGRLLVEDLVERAKELGLSRIMALTYVPEFFHRLGFHTVQKEIFPEKVWGVCVKCSKFDDCNEIAVLRVLR